MASSRASKTTVSWRLAPVRSAASGSPAALDHNMALRARFAAIRGVRADGLAPLLAGMLAESRRGPAPVDRSASPRRSSSTWCSRSHTPASCQSRSRRQQVMPEPQPISWGSISQGMPVFSTKMMPVRAARSGTRGRPPLGLGGSGGSSGATRAHNSSLTSGLPCPRSTMPHPVLKGTLRRQIERGVATFGVERN